MSDHFWNVLLGFGGGLLGACVAIVVALTLFLRQEKKEA